MYPISPRVLRALLFLCLLSSPLTQADESEFGKSIFVFHKKLAENGSTLSQYKLGTMYELGLGTSSNIEESRRWYTIAAEKGHSAASDRLTYLEIRQNSYNPARHENWLNKLQKQAQNNDAESLFLLGQLYQNGIGVDQNLNQAILLMRKAGVLGMTEADLQAEALQQNLKNRKPTSKEPKISNPVSSTKNKPEPTYKKSKQEKARERRLRYEAVMRKLEQERLILERQQKWAESQ